MDKILEIHNLLISNTIGIANKRLNKIVCDYSFYYFDSKLDFGQNEEIYQKIKESKVIIIGSNIKTSSVPSDFCFFIGFKKTIICIKNNLLHLLYPFFSYSNGLNILFLSNTKDIFNRYIKIKYKEVEFCPFFEDEISNFNESFILTGKKDSSIIKIWNNIQTYISGYLIKQSYLKLEKNRIKEFNLNNKNSFKSKKFEEDEYIEIRKINSGSNCHISLIYHIEKEELFVIKQIYNTNVDYLLNREEKNYSKIKHEFLPAFYGTTKNDNFIVIEFINGETLASIDKLHLTEIEKYTIIFQLLSVFGYLHQQHFIYRDLKPNNIMIDKNKTMVLIDFDRMITDKVDDCSNDFSSLFMAPEILKEHATTESDIYSIGKMIYYIINEKYPSNEPSNDSNELSKNPDIKLIYDHCTSENIEKRPSINYLIFLFAEFIIRKNIILENVTKDDMFKLGITAEMFNNNSDLIQYLTLAANQNHLEAQHKLATIYYDEIIMTRDINKVIHYLNLAANQNHSEAQLFLAYLYYKGEDIERNANKALHYLTLAANQNHSEAQLFLAYLYYEGEDIEQNINKALHYLTLAANQNYSGAQYKLGIIYYEGKHIAQDINKAIHFLSLAANQNHSVAQYKLGIIYYKGKYVAQDINKAIHYFTLAAKQNLINAQYNLGLIYYKGKYIKRDINKSIYYFKLASDQNDAKSQFYIGLIYYKAQYVTRNIEKSIYFFSLAAKQNYSDAQLYIGYIYYEGKYVKRDINKSISFLTLAANSNHPDAQLVLGYIYYEGKYVIRDIDKSISFLTLAANQDYSDAQVVLGYIYFTGEFVASDISKSIFYFTQAANQNEPTSQLYLGYIYYNGFVTQRNIIRGIDYLMKSMQNNSIYSYFPIGFLYHEGKYVNLDIKKAIHFYKEASSFNNNYAKNNLGIIYKNGFNDEIQKNIGNAIEYFNESIKLKNDPVSMFNLAHIFIFEESLKEHIKESIKLLLQSAKQNFIPSIQLLPIAMIIIHGNNIFNIINELFIYNNEYGDILDQIIKNVQNFIVYDLFDFEQTYADYKNINFLYDINGNAFQSNKLLKSKEKCKSEEKNNKYNINSYFYEGLGDI